MRVLYVEDNPTNVFLVKRVAKVGQHEVINFVDGSEALRKYDDIDPDLVLMDVQLSGELSGLDVVRQLRARGIDVPIIAVTAYAMVGDKERCIEAGCTDYLAKPLPVPRLVEIFQEYSDAVEAAKKASPAKAEQSTAAESTVTPSEEDKAESEETSAKQTEAKTEVQENATVTEADTEETDDTIAQATATDEKSLAPEAKVQQVTDVTTNEITKAEDADKSSSDGTDKDKKEAETT